jgi:uncharacterized protein
VSTRRSFLLQSVGAVAATAEIKIAQASAKTTDPSVASKRLSREGVLQPIDLARVSLGGEFGQRVKKIVEANILKIDIDKTLLSDFRQRGEGGEGRYVGLGKFLDAVVRLAAASADSRLVALKRRVIADLVSTQEPDGYIGTIADPDSRMKVLWDLHENGYLIWALVSDYQFFGEADSLKVAQRMADYALTRLAANPAGPSLKYDGVEAFSVASIGFDRALLALSRATGQERYRQFAVNFLKLNSYYPEICPGSGEFINNHAYGYLAHCVAQIDLYRETGDPQLLRATRRALAFLRHGDGLLVTGSCSDRELWDDSQSGLQFTSETCAAAYLSRLMDAMLRLEGDSLYGDIMERDIYNALFAATAPDGSRSRYFTPFEGRRVYDSHGNRFCCANNNKRFLADLGGWMYYRTRTGVAVNLYNASTVTLGIEPNVMLRIEQLTDYPTSGNVLLKIDPSAEARFEIKLRIPRWCKAADVSINGEKSMRAPKGGFYRLERHWKPGDTIALRMPMEWRFIRGRRSQSGRVAILRGPVIFTLNPERNPKIRENSDFEPRLMTINPSEIEPPSPDDTIRLGGQSCTVKAWPPGIEVSPGFERIPLVLTEYPDPQGRCIYFMVPAPASSLVSDDDLI